MLTAYRSDDAAALLEMDRDPEIARRFEWDPHNATLENCAAHIVHTHDWWSAGERAAFAVRQSADGPLLGTVEARREDDGRIELSWMTRPDHRRRGVATRAVAALRDWCFKTGADAVWAKVEADNDASLGVARRADMREDRREGRWARLVAHRRG